MYPEFNKEFFSNLIGFACKFVSARRLENDLETLASLYQELLFKESPSFNHIPTLSKAIGFVYREKLAHLPALD